MYVTSSVNHVSDAQADFQPGVAGDETTVDMMTAHPRLASGSTACSLLSMRNEDKTEWQRSSVQTTR